MLKWMLVGFFVALSAAWSFGAASFERIESSIPSRSQIEDFDLAAGIASNSRAREISRLALEMIKDFEGWVAQAYDDAANYCTIGFGHLIKLQSCALIADLGEFASPISIQRGTEILEADTLSARIAVSQLVDVDLTDEQYGALVSFTFNVGKRNFETSTMLRLLNDAEYELAARQFGRWVKAGGVVLDGLIARRQCESALFSGALSLRADRTFDRNSCTGLGVAGDGVDLVDIEIGE